MNKVLIRGRSYEGIVSFMSKEYPDVLEISFIKNTEDQFYDDFYQNDYLRNTRKYQAAKIIKKLKSYIFSAQSILEVGCGNGVFIDELSKIHDGYILGIDPCLKEETENKKKYNLFEFNHRKFDCIVLLDVFEHFENNAQALEKIMSLLSENGHLILKVPNKNALFYKISKFLSLLNKSALARLYQIDFPPQHFYYYNQKSLRNLCEKAGLKYNTHFYMTEVPLRGLNQRLWGLSVLHKIIAMPCAFIYNIIALGFLKDSLVVCFNKR